MDRSDKKEEFVFMARLAEQTERFEDMVIKFNVII